MGTKHPGCNIRVHSSIGQDNRVGNWQNNMFSITEIDAENAVVVNLTTY